MSKEIPIDTDETNYLRMALSRWVLRMPTEQLKFYWDRALEQIVREKLDEVVER